MLSGGTPSSKHPEYYGGPYPFVTTPCLGKNYIDSSDAVNWLSEIGVEKSSTHIIPAYSIMYGSRVGVGKSSINTCDMCTNQDILSFFNIDTSKYDLLFIKKVMDQYFDYVDAQKRGSTIKGVPSDVVKSIRIPVVAIEEQKSFAAFTEQSDKSKFTGFKSQFIEMFGDPTENPNGWIKLTVKDAVTQGYIARPLDGNHGEKHPKGDDYVPEGVPFLMAQDLIDKRVDFNNCHFITEKQASTLKKGWAKEGDVLLTHKGTIGRVAIVQPSQYESMLLTPQITYYRCLKDIDNEYLAAYFMTGFFVEQLERLTTGTTRACVTITQQERLELIIPPVSMQRDFVKFVNQSDKSK